MEETYSSNDASPYRVLHLREGAPRELVEETYWHLVGKLRYGITSEETELQRVDELSRAYESIVRNGHGTVPGAHRSVIKRWRWYGGRRRREAWKLDPFETLFVTEDVAPDVAVLARKVLASQVPTGMDRVVWDRTLEDAAAKVCDQAWRACRERDEATVDPPATREATVTEATGEDHATHDREPTERTSFDADAMATDTDMMFRDTAEASEDGGEHDVGGPATAPDEERGEAAATTGSATERVTSGPSLVRDVLDRLIASKARREATIEAENERLLRLRTVFPVHETEDSAEGGIPSSGDLYGNGTLPSAPLTFVAQSATTSDEITDEEHQLTLGEGSNPSRIQVWRRGERYLLQQVAGPPVSVNGLPLLSPVIVLEDGDEVASNGEVMKIQVQS